MLNGMDIRGQHMESERLSTFRHPFLKNGTKQTSRERPEIGALLKVQNEQSAWNIRGTTLVKLFNYHTVPKIPEWLRLENNFFELKTNIMMMIRKPHIFGKKKGFLTLNGQGNFRIHPKIWCLNFKLRIIARSFERRQPGLWNWFLNCWAGGPLAWPFAHKMFWAKSSTGVWLRYTCSGLCAKT